jgi:hypothetical protein
VTGQELVLSSTVYQYTCATRSPVEVSYCNGGASSWRTGVGSLQYNVSRRRKVLQMASPKGCGIQEEELDIQLSSMSTVQHLLMKEDPLHNKYRCPQYQSAQPQINHVSLRFSCYGNAQRYRCIARERKHRTFVLSPSIIAGVSFQGICS